MGNDLEKCLYYKISRSQREEERKRREGDSGTSGFERIGYYSCDGIKKDCTSYFPKGRLAK